MPAPTHPSNLQRRIHAGGGRVLEQRKSIGVRIHTTPQVGADGKLRRFLGFFQVVPLVPWIPQIQITAWASSVSH